MTGGRRAIPFCLPAVVIALLFAPGSATAAATGPAAEPKPPRTEIVEAETGRHVILTRVAPAFFRFRSEGGAVGFECRVDRGRWQPCRSGRFLTYLGPGHHQFRVRAINGEGAVDSTPAVRRWRFVRWQPDVEAASEFAASREGRVSFSVDLGWRSWNRGASVRARMASTVKAMLMVAYLNMEEVRSRKLTDYEKGLISPMITVSDNDAANAIASMVGPARMRSLARRVGMEGFEYSTIWGRSKTGAADQARFMRALPNLLPEPHRGWAMGLLSRIEGYQRWGIPEVRPKGWRLFFKGGWGISDGSLGGTVNHQIALLERGGLRIGIAILTEGNPWTSYGESTLKGVARRILKGLPRVRPG